ncbi:hypothetical protein LQ757_06180 [Agromyces sp. SYSU K20354]|uniref:hypothetical protein n=1 Tax=Agromyces cavernae TaxID=2898659 RepID=UPI001E644A31|nr:hypothetical protein [Agromyces cavernae]MCD2441863.1 hypothetical protein [Agromyces cavernae]
MPRLTLLLVDGFVEDEVVVTIDGREVARRKPVTTMLLTGSAGSIRVDAPSGKFTVGVSVPSRLPLPEAALETRADATLLADLSEGGIRLIEGTGREGVL